MARVLLIKTSSLGDVVHNLAVVNDIHRAMPGSTIDWVVEEAYASIPALHPGVCGIIPVAVRRWRKSVWLKTTRSEIRGFLLRLRQTQYDAVIDTQGLFKSALIARAAHGPRYGLDWRSAREPLAWLYERTFRVSWRLHAVERNRSLVAQALRYPVPHAMEYGIHAAKPEYAWLPAAPYAVLLHGTSVASKLWPEEQWIALGQRLAAVDLRAVLPWGSDAERERSARLAREIPRSVVSPALALSDAARVLGGARCVLGVDTGLTHLAAALGVPTVGIYVSTDPAATGVYAASHAVNIGTDRDPPSADDVFSALASILR